MSVVFGLYIILGFILGIANFIVAGKAPCKSTSHGSIAFLVAFLKVAVSIGTLIATGVILGVNGGLSGSGAPANNEN